LEKSHEGEGYGYIFEEIITIDNEWLGWGTALKPAHEPIALARKPIKLSIAKNCQTHGVGALNIDATRVGDEIITSVIKTNEDNSIHHRDKGQTTPKVIDTQDNVGRFPSNVLGDIPDYQKYFYCPKVSRRERHIGFDLKKVPTIEHNDPATIHLHPLWTPAIGKNVYRLKAAIEEFNNKVPEPLFGNVQGCYDPETGERFAGGFDKAAKGNNHPTVKPIELMKYLIKLITPKGGKVLDPFNGSGSTGCAAVELGCEYVGIELDPAYVEIAKKRIEAWNKEDTAFNELFE
jgi:site-specific DNA-methyltransferase (adenine-specific)